MTDTQAVESRTLPALLQINLQEHVRANGVVVAIAYSWYVLRPEATRTPLLSIIYVIT